MAREVAERIQQDREAVPDTSDDAMEQVAKTISDSSKKSVDFSKVTKTAVAPVTDSIVDPMKLQFYGHMVISDRPKDVPASRSPDWMLRHLLPQAINFD